MATADLSDLNACEVSRRHDGAIVVRIPSRRNNGHTLPDAVFSFRAGDPQYSYWESQLQSRKQPES